MASPYQGDDVDPFSGARDEEGNITSVGSTTKEDKERDAREEGVSGPLKKQTFKEAFAAAKDGSIFTWNGKKYKKEYAKPKAKAKTKDKTSKSVSTAGDIASRNAAQLTPLMKAATQKVPRRPSVSTAGAIASRNMKSGGSVKASKSKSSRGDGCATRGKTRGRMC